MSETNKPDSPRFTSPYEIETTAALADLDAGAVRQIVSSGTWHPKLGTLQAIGVVHTFGERS